MTALPAIFNPEPSDNEDVVSALETADIFWTKGDTDEALRWLKRAAETASDTGNDMRALAIARSAADLKSGNGSGPASVAAEAPIQRKSRPPTPPSNNSKQPPLPPSSTAAASDGAARTPTTGAPQKSPPPLPPSKPRESIAPSPPSKASAAPPPHSHSASAAPAPRTASSDRLPAVTTETRAAPVRASVPAPTPSPASVPAPAAAAEAPVRRAPSPSTLPKEPQRAITPATAYRAITVFVKPQGRNGDKLEVIIAKPGQPIPAGAEPALLVPTRRGGRLLG